MGIETVIILVQAALMVISIGLSYALKPKAKGAGTGPPTTIKERGSFLPLVIGVRAVGPSFGWAGDRHSAGGGAGATWYEGAWHPLLVGPGARLKKITRNGKLVWKGPVGANAAPSGTKIPTTNSGAFTIYWGEADQPVSAFLADVSRLDVGSRWPFVMHVTWENFKMGSVAIWPEMMYHVEVRPFGSKLQKSKSWFDPTIELGAKLYKVVAATNGLPGTAKITVIGNAKKVFITGSYLRLSGSGSPADGDHEVLSAAVNSLAIPDPDTGQVSPITVTIITLATTLTGAMPTGTVQTFVELEDDGANHAHVLYQLLFAPWPHGAGKSTDLFDIDSLEALGQRCETERLLCSIDARGGMTVRGAIEMILTDVGCFMPWDPTIGKYRFIPIRHDANEVIAHLGDDELLAPLPESSNRLGLPTQNRLIFEFNDRAINYKNRPVNIGDDSGPKTTVKVEKVGIDTVVDAASAKKIAERRAQEGLPGAARVTVYAGRAARDIVPSRRFTINDLFGRWRVVEVRPQVTTPKTAIVLVADHYSSGPPSEAPTDPTEGGVTLELPEADPVAFALEIPAYYGTKGVVEYGFPRARAKSSITGAALMLSSNGTSYVEKGKLNDLTTGGKLLAAMTANLWDHRVVEQGPSIVIYGPDASIIEDVSADPAAWYAGRQWCVIGREVCFLRGVTPLGNNHYRLDGLIRGRLGTRVQEHPIGELVAIFNADNLARWTDPLFVPNGTFHTKVIPVVEDDSIDPADVQPIVTTVVGGTVAPLAPVNLNVRPRYNLGYRTGEAIEFFWSYHSLAVPFTAAGMQQSGAPYTPAPVDGSFTIVFKTTGGVVKKTVTSLVLPTYTLSNANLVSAFGSEPTSFIVELTHVLSGFASTPLAVTITKN